MTKSFSSSPSTSLFLVFVLVVCGSIPPSSQNPCHSRSLRALSLRQISLHLSPSRLISHLIPRRYKKDVSVFAQDSNRQSQESNGRNQNSTSYVHVSKVKDVSLRGRGSLRRRRLRESSRRGRSKWIQEEASLNFSGDVVLPSTVIEFTEMLRRCHDRDSVNLALAVLDRSGIKPNVIALTAIIGACCRSKMWKKAMDFWHDMEKNNGKSFLTTRKLRLDVQAYTAGLQAMSIGVRWEKAFRLVRSMVSQRLRLNAHVYTTVITCATRGQKWETGLRLARQASERSISNNIHLFSASQAAMLAGKQWERALRLSRAFHNSTENSSMSTWNKPTPVTYGTYLSACAAGAQWEEAYACFQYLDRDANERKFSRGMLNSHIIACTIQALSQGNQDAIEILDDIIARLGLEIAGDWKAKGPPLTPNIVVINSVLKAFERAARWQRALEVISRSHRRSIKPDVVSLTTAMCALYKGARQDTIAKLDVDRILAKRIPENVYSPKNNGTRTSRRMSRRLNIGEKAVNFATNDKIWLRGIELYDRFVGKGVVPNVQCFDALARLHAIGNNWLGAMNALVQIRMRNLRVNVQTYSAIIDACGNCRKWQTALSMITRMMESTIIPKITTVTSAISACQRSEKWIQALALLNLPKALGLRWDRQIYDTAIASLVSSHQWEAAIRAFSRMPKLGMERDVVVFNAALFACLTGRKWEKAEGFVQEMILSKVKPDLRTWRQLFRTYVKSRQWQRARDILTKFTKSVGGSKDSKRL